jgi:hypothetical protein
MQDLATIAMGTSPANMKKLLDREADSRYRFGDSRQQVAIDMALSMLSDAQELMRFKDPKSIVEATCAINRAKWLLINHEEEETTK